MNEQNDEYICDDNKMQDSENKTPMIFIKNTTKTKQNIT